MVTYIYSESDDKLATTEITRREAMELLQEHNEYFGTDYKTIPQFNKGEQYRKITIYYNN